VGVNVLRNDARAALGICACTGATFLRVNVHVGSMLTDQGVLTGRAAETLRERGRLCPDVVLAADVHVKHARPLAAESLEEAARETVERGGADVLIVSGTRTGAPPEAQDLERLRETLSGTPLWIGSGLDADNAARLLAMADGAIVGTALKEGGRVSQPVDPRRVERLRRAFDTLARS
jgi:membrane complex biogenesis BtpA family protein